MVDSKFCELLHLLSDGEFHSGEKLGQQLKISRSAIWKQIEYLREHFELSIESVSNKGYRLLQAFEALSKEKIMAALDSNTNLENLLIFTQIDSTNRYLMSLAQQGLRKNTACFAEQQTAGKGRHDRVWISPFGQNIYLSLLWNFNCDPSQLGGLSLAIATAVIDTLKIYDCHFLGIKWPNDIVCQQKKLAGILIEMLSIPNSHCQAIIGVGLNVKMSSKQAEKIDQAWGALSEITQKTIIRNDLAGLLLKKIIATVEQFEKEGLCPFLESWRQHDALYDKEITLQHHQQTISGLAKGISDKGELILQDQNNLLRCFHSGEVTRIRAARVC